MDDSTSIFLLDDLFIGGAAGADPTAAYATLNGTNERFTLGDVLDSVFAGANATFRIVAVVRPGAVMANNMIVGKLLATGNNRQFFTRLVTGSVPELVWYGDGPGATYRSSMGTTAITDTGKWYTIEFSYDGTAAVDSRVGIKVDGTDETTPNLSVGSPTQIQDLAADLEFGSFNGGGGYWDGDIASIKIYDAASGGSLVAQYDFDTTLGTTLVDKVGSNHGKLVGAPSTVWSNYTPPANAGVFDGVDDYVHRASDPIGGGAWSLHARIKHDGTAIPTYQTLLNRGPSGATTKVNIRHDAAGVLLIHGVGHYRFWDYPATLFNDEWHDVTFVVPDPSDPTTFLFYMDGTLQTVDADSTATASTPDKLQVGGNTDDGQYMPGSVALGDVYSKVLTVDEILYLSTNGEAGTDPGVANIVVRYNDFLPKVDQGQVDDQSGNGNHGTWNT